MQLPDRYDPIKAELKQVDQLLLEILSEADQPVKQATIQLLQSGGKRIRPLLCLLSSHFGKKTDINPHKIASAIELVHMSSLIHDDIIDHASLRRGQPTIHKTHTNKLATYIGNYLFAQSLEVMTDINHPILDQIFSKTLKKLAVGELEQFQNRYQMNPSFKLYLRKNRNKTARLIAISCQLGAIAANTSEQIQQSLYWFGYYLGMSYQIIDDILDFTGPDHTLGKQSGQDLSEGYLTLPSILALRDKSIYASISTQFAGQLTDQPVDFKPIVNQIKQTDAIETSYKVSQWYLNRALEELKQLPEQPEKQLFYQMIGYLSKRNH